MALSVTPGTGGSVATEVISSVNYSQAKLVDATVGSTTPTGVAANPLQVSLANTGANSTLLLVQDKPETTGGVTPYKLISAATTNATSLKGSAGQIYSIQAFNINASPRYLKIYNKATAPTVGTDTPVKVLMIPGNTAGNGFIFVSDKGVALGTGIAFAITSGMADADTGAVAAADIVVNIDYI